MKFVIVAGSNIGDSRKTLSQLPDWFGKWQIKILKQTEVLTTQPELVHDQQAFLNCAFLVATDLDPEALLRICQEIEKQNGRINRRRYGPRELDLDIVWAERDFQSATLKIPHPENRNREWVRQFIYNLDNDLVDTLTGISYSDMQTNSIRNVLDFKKKKSKNEKITVLTCYDYSFAKLFAQTTLDCVLVGDSLGHIIKGEENTLNVSVDEMIYHCKAVRRGLPDKFIVADMPFLSAATGKKNALRNAGRILSEGRANAVKIEGAGKLCKVIRTLVEAGIPVMGHLGLQPQNFHTVGGYKLQARAADQQKQLLEDAKSLEAAGVFGIVLEMIPAEIGHMVSKELAIPTIGIGAGNGTDGQVLVCYDLLGMDQSFSPTFLRRYANLSETIIKSIEHFCVDVRKNDYPSDKESF